MNNSIERLATLLNQIFPNTALPPDITNLGYGVIEEWDSLANYALLLLVEENFKINFSMQELSEIRTIKDIIKKIDEC